MGRRQASASVRMRAAPDGAEVVKQRLSAFCFPFASVVKGKKERDEILLSSLQERNFDSCACHTRAHMRRENGAGLPVTRHPEVAAKRPSKDDGPNAAARHPSRLAALAPQDDGNNACTRRRGPLTPTLSPRAGRGNRERIGGEKCLTTARALRPRPPPPPCFAGRSPSPAVAGEEEYHLVFSNISRPISMRRISLVPAPIS